MRHLFIYIVLAVSGVAMAAEPIRTVEDITVCLGSTIMLESDYEKNYYRWIVDGTEVSGASSIEYKAETEGLHKITCEPYNDPTELKDAMAAANGDFEGGYVGFTSDFRPITKGGKPVINPIAIYSGKYDNGDWDQSSQQSGAKGYYAITNNAQNLQSDKSIFKPIKPHGGEEFLVVDAFADGYAWKVENLTVKTGTTYEFSYWVTTPNARPYELGFKPKLQFIITYKDQYGFETDKNLGAAYEVGTEDGDEKWKWHQNKELWTVPADVVSVTIGVKNLTKSADGNDFCLDDIVFMPLGEPESAIVETFNVTVVNCDPECENLIYSKWNDVLVVNNDKDSLQTYQWYRDDAPIDGATLQYYKETIAGGVAGHKYMVKGTKVDKSKYMTCEIMFDAAPRSATLVDVTKKVTAVRRHSVGAHFVIEETIYEDGSRDIVKQLK